MMSNKSSFQKKRTGKVIFIPGTKPSIHNSQLLTSSGITSLDSILGGGLPVGSIILIEEDRYNKYSSIFVKLFLAEGVANNHYIHFVCLDEDPLNFLHHLPLLSISNNELQNNSNNDDIKIAWRYQQKNAHTLDKQDKYYDLSKNMEFNDFKNLSSFWKNDDDNNSSSISPIKYLDPFYESLLENIKSIILKRDTLVTHKSEANLLRIAISSILSPLWNSNPKNYDHHNRWGKVTAFFTILKSIIRSSYSVAMITIPSYILNDPSLLSRLYGIVDFAIKLEPFYCSDKEVNPAFKDYHGLLYVKKMASINTIVRPKIDSLEWAFTLKKRNLLIKRLHLPPELSETVSREADEETSCTKLPKHLEF